MEFNDSNATDEISQTNEGSPATYGQQVAMTVVILIFGIWSTAGNLLTILAITTKRYMRTKTNVFILSLAISDLLSAIIASPLWLYRRTWGFNPWELGQFACKLYWFADESTSYCTAMHIASFAIWRFILVRWPHRMGTTKIKTIIIWVVTIWVISIIFGGFIYSTFYDSIPKPQDGGVYSYWPMCSINFLNNGVAKFRAYYTTAITIFIFVPMFILIVVSLMIATELHSEKTYKSELRKVKEKRAVMQLALVASSFMIGYLPMSTYMMWTIRVSNKNKLVDYWLAVSAYFALRLSECMNPIAYNVSSEKMRLSSMQVLRSMCPCSLRKDELSTRTPTHISHSSRNDTGGPPSNAGSKV